MPTYAVHISVAGPFRDTADGQRFASAYSERYVSADTPAAAEQRALSLLFEEQQFVRLRRETGIGPPDTTVDSVREASWLEGLMSKKALVLCREASRSDASQLPDTGRFGGLR